MKRIFLTLVLFAAVLIGAAQIVPVQAKTFRINYGAQSFSINLNSDSILMSSTEPVWFNTKFGSDTLLFGDGTYMTTAPTGGGVDTGYVKTTGDTLYNNYWFKVGRVFFAPLSTTIGVSLQSTWIKGDSLQMTSDVAEFAHSNCTAFVYTEVTPGCIEFYNSENRAEAFRISARHDCYEQDTIVSGNGLIINSPTLTTIGRFNGIDFDGDSTDLINDASIVLTNGISGWGEVYAFNAGAIDEWAEFIISSDGAVYLKSNSTDVVNTDTANKLCIFDNGSGVTIRNRLGGTRIIKYIIHH